MKVKYEYKVSFHRKPSVWDIFEKEGSHLFEDVRSAKAYMRQLNKLTYVNNVRLFRRPVQPQWEEIADGPERNN